MKNLVCSPLYIENYEIIKGIIQDLLTFWKREEDEEIHQMVDQEQCT